MASQTDESTRGGRLGRICVRSIGVAVFCFASFGFVSLTIEVPQTLTNFGPPIPALHAAQPAYVVFLLCTVVLSAIAILCIQKPSIVVESCASATRLGGSSAGQVVTMSVACGLFMFIGPCLIMLNKYIMQTLAFDYPLSLSGLGLLASAVVSRLLVDSGLAPVRPESQEAVAGSRWYRIAFPIGVCRAITLSTGNAVYLYLGVGFIQMLKAFTPVIVLWVMRVAGTTQPTRAAVWFTWIIVGGTLVLVKGELQATVFGVMLMLLSSIGEAITLVLSQKMLQNMSFTVIEGLYVTAPAGAFCLAVAAVPLEWPRMLERGDQAIIVAHPWEFIAASLMGMCVNFLTLIVVQVTSSLTVKILNVGRCIGLVVIGVFFYEEASTSLQMLGYGTALVGFAGYNYVQMNPDNAEIMEQWVDNNCCDAFSEKQGPESGPEDDGSAIA